MPAYLQQRPVGVTPVLMSLHSVAYASTPAKELPTWGQQLHLHIPSLKLCCLACIPNLL